MKVVRRLLNLLKKNREKLFKLEKMRIKPEIFKFNKNLQKLGKKEQKKKKRKLEIEICKKKRKKLILKKKKENI